MSQDREIVRTRQRNTSCPTRCGGRRGCEAETCPPHASCHLALIVSAFLPPPFLRGFLGAAGVSWNASWPSLTVTSTRSEEHTSELQSLMRISYAVFCLKKKKNQHHKPHNLMLTMTNNYTLITKHT